MKKTFKDQLPVFIPECILFVTAVTFAVLLMINFGYTFSYIHGNMQFLGTKGSMIDLVLSTVSACVICATSVALICMGHIFKGKDKVKWIDKASFISGVVLLAYDICLTALMFGLLFRAEILPIK